jgi:para-aminobenzoate synthetase component 1
MEIIDELEPNNRSIYCGSIGYIGFDEKTDLNISIRTMLAVDNNLIFLGRRRYRN